MKKDITIWFNGDVMLPPITPYEHDEWLLKVGEDELLKFGDYKLAAILYALNQALYQGKVTIKGCVYDDDVFRNIRSFDEVEVEDPVIIKEITVKGCKIKNITKYGLYFDWSYGNDKIVLDGVLEHCEIGDENKVDVDIIVASVTGKEVLLCRRITPHIE